MADDFYRSPGLGEGLGRLARGAGGMFSGIHDWSAPRSNRLMLAGMGMLSGKGAAEGWEGAMKGYVAGSALDKDTKRERALAEMMSDPSSTLGNLPAGDRAYVMGGGDEIVGPLMAARLKPKDTPGSWDEYVLTLPPGVRPTPEGYSAYQDKDAARNRIVLDAGTTNKYSDITATRQEALKRPGYTDYNNALPIVESMRESVYDTSSTSDLDFVYGLVGVFDPNTAVHQEDAGFVIESQSIPSAIRQKIQKLTVKGGPGLGPDIRKELVNTAQRRLKYLRKKAEREGDYYIDFANRHGIPPEDIWPGLAPMPEPVGERPDTEFTEEP